jgi:hypothetical protein
MKRVLGFASEFAGLFVDDRRFAATIVVWIGLVAVALHAGGSSGSWLGPVLFAGLSMNLLASVIRASKQRR